MDHSKIGNERQQNDNMIAVADARRLGDCWQELSAYFDGSDLEPTDYVPRQLAVYQQVHGNADTPAARQWIKTCIMQDKAAKYLRSAIRGGRLTIWRIHEAREIPMAALNLNEGNIRYGVFKSFERPEPAAQGAHLWVKDADWAAYRDQIEYEVMRERNPALEGVPIPVAIGELIAVAGDFDFNAPTVISPWWSTQQALAWIATRSAAYVAHIGREEDGRERDIARTICMTAMACDVAAHHCVCDASKSAPPAHWTHCTCVGDAGRLLLEQIRLRHVSPTQAIDGRSSVMPFHAFAGVGQDQDGTDWLNLKPLPIFSSSELIAVFPADGAAKSGNVTKGRKRPGPAPDPDWPQAIAAVKQDCIASGYTRQRRRGDKAAIQTMLLSFMANRDKHFSEDAAAKYAEMVIAQLPDN